MGNHDMKHRRVNAKVVLEEYLAPLKTTIPSAFTIRIEEDALHVFPSLGVREEVMDGLLL